MYIFASDGTLKCIVTGDILEYTATYYNILPQIRIYGHVLEYMAT